VQLEPASADVTKLACEIVFIYFLFTSTVSGNRKRELIKEIASWKNVEIEGEAARLLSELDTGIGGTGQAYHQRQPFEIASLGNVALQLAATQPSEREAILNNHLKFRKLLDDVAPD